MTPAGSIMSRALEAIDSSQTQEGVRGGPARIPRSTEPMIASNTYTERDLGVSAESSGQHGGRR